MSRRRLALALSSPSSPADPGSPKGSHGSGKKSGGRRGRSHRRETTTRVHPALWTEVEEAFFAAAPPDEPAAPAQPESFDDLGPPAPGAGWFRLRGAALWSAVRRLFVRSARPVPNRS